MGLLRYLGYLGAKKRKTAIKGFYFVERVCKDEKEALEAIKSEGIWANYCRSNPTVNLNYGELLQWVQDHSRIPEDKH